MASAKKKLDEYHLRVLRQIVTQPVNKQCFDCNQRGPTYVNVTIGSFVCTTCSGMLRGLTPPHRVKSISMATFTPEEVHFIKARGNEYCRRIWLGLCDSQQPTKDEQQIKDFMISKYERKRYYLDPAPTLNGSASNGNVSPISKPSTPSVQLKIQSSSSSKTLPTPAIIPPNSLAFKAAPTPQVNNINAFTPEPSFNADFSNLANTTPSDPFSSASQFATTPSTQQSFANFDNNPIFNNSSAPEVDNFSDMIQSSSSSLPQMLFPMLNVPMRVISAKSNCVPTDRWSIAGIGETGSVPGEDRYAALKDLDSQMKSQQQQQTVETQPPAPDWNNGVSNVWQAPSAFNPLSQSVDNNITSNPFKGENAWTNGNSLGANPFRNSRPVTEVLWPVVANGQIPNGFPTSQSLNFAPSKLPWNSEAISNPFVLGNTQQQTTGHHSSNPFL